MKNVLQQMMNDSVIHPGTLVEKGSVIDLVLGMGLSNETTTVPDLTGMDLPGAKEAISDRYLNFGLATFDASVTNEEDSLNARVFRQSPSYDGYSGVKKGIQVFIWLTVDSTLLPLPDTTLTGQNADFELNEETL